MKFILSIIVFFGVFFLSSLCQVIGLDTISSIFKIVSVIPIIMMIGGLRKIISKILF